MLRSRYGIGVRVNGVDVGNVVIAGGRITRGRLDALEQPQPDTLTLTVFTRQGWPQNPQSWFEYGAGGNSTSASGFEADHDTEDTYLGPPTYLGLDSDIWVSLTTDTGFSAGHDTEDTYLGREYRRFTGKVNALDYGYERLDIHAVSSLEAWARRALLVSPSFQPSEDSTDVDLAQWFAAVVPAPTTLHVVGADGPVMLHYAADEYPLCLLDVLREIAADADALVYATREGNVTYQTRHAAHPVTAIPGHVVDVDALAMSLELGASRNRITVEYGVAPTSGTPPVPAGPRPTVTHNLSGPQSIYGRREDFVTSRLRDAAAADDHALTILNQNDVEWAMPDLSVRMILATAAEVEAVADVDLGDRLEVVGLPSGAPVEAHVGEVVGYTEALSSEEWEIEFHLGPAYTRVVGSGGGGT